jgi:hypothetical protein
MLLAYDVTAYHLLLLSYCTCKCGDFKGFHLASERAMLALPRISMTLLVEHPVDLEGPRVAVHSYNDDIYYHTTPIAVRP